MPDEIKVPVSSEAGVVSARQEGRAMAEQLGFSSTEQTLIATAISEVARNIIQYAHRGEVGIRVVAGPGRRGIKVIAQDEGPGIPDIEKAMRDGYTTGKGMGLGLSGARRLMDEFHIESQVGNGTVVTLVKWNHRVG